MWPTVADEHLTGPTFLEEIARRVRMMREPVPPRCPSESVARGVGKIRCEMIDGHPGWHQAGCYTWHPRWGIRP